MAEAVKFDEVGYWSEIKLEILQKYASAYSRILASRKAPSFRHLYIEGFAGAGAHISKATNEFVPGKSTERTGGRLPGIDGLHGKAKVTPRSVGAVKRTAEFRRV